ncbi:lactosylceramide 4-alpha-galactosyltransferase-like [Macrobrachium rosenbergii]|uniref:lactosylceramide 4-alpha-galactosyltransferase-like n=1 Tax=Macrobrachium rosenbergii TaxID=79674 RepID=UPI0034D6EECF
MTIIDQLIKIIFALMGNRLPEQRLSYDTEKNDNSSQKSTTLSPMPSISGTEARLAFGLNSVLCILNSTFLFQTENDSASSHFNVPTGQLEVPSTVPSSSDEFRTPGDGGGCPLSSSAPQGRSLQLDDLFSYESEWRSAPYNIFLQESSCNPKPSYRVWCAVESLAQQNPDALVWYIMTSPVADQSDDLAPSLTQIYKNLRVAKVDLKTVFSNTPLEDIYTAGLWRKNNTWPEINLADIMRLAVVWKMGGLYADSDVVCIRQVTQLTNMIAWQEGFTLGSGVFHFSRHHPVLKLVMEYIKDNFQPEKWGSSGPIVFTRS